MSDEKTLNELLDTIAELRTDIKELDETRSTLKIKLMDYEAITINKLEEQGIDRIGNDTCTVSIRKEIVPAIEDWDEVYTYIKETGQFELLHKRMAATAYRELQSMGADVPGVKAKELPRSNFRSK